MKKSVIYSLCGLLCFALISTANASVCSNEEQVKLKKIASSVGVTYEEAQEKLDPSMYVTNDDVGYDPVYLDYFKVIFSNVPKESYIEITNDYDDEIKFIRYQDTEDGVYSFDWKNTDKITKFTYEVFSSAETSCPDEKFYTGYLVLPKYNEVSASVRCKGLEDLPACQKYITSDMDPEEQERQIEERQKELAKEEEKKNKKAKIGDFVKDHMAIIIAGSTIVIAGVATVVVKNKRKRVK